MLFKKDKPEHVVLALMACLGVYLFVFMYLQISSFPDYRQRSSFDTYSELVQDQVELKADNIESDSYNGGPVSSVTRNLNDDRASSMEDWSESQYEGNPEENAREIERQLFDDTGQKEKREELLDSHQARLDAFENKKDTKPSSNRDPQTQFSGNVMVDFDLSGRTAFKNDNWYVRNPGYTCGTNSIGLVVVDVKVNRNGNVVGAQINSTSSNGLSECMIKKAIAYAKMSRFNYTAAASQIQTGVIRYRFVAQ
mgnify:FL=1